ncbi:ABC transporter permease [Pedobacter lusitanus]|uniref:ABC transporter permease n=1 Tax=Pedobacter lusitanus TaxID=1503925 RepID=A0A0D0FUJ7_9SPHI|nr:FtsX-like permease family protein [Pedobacter lusitanus]KIO76114.1 ABC transporter permease [Pedobacter lusitanus]
MPDQQPNLQKRIAVSWLFKMAWRDSRKNRSRLFLFTSSIILGITALVAVYSFGDNLQRDIDEQAKTLTGADLIIDSRKAISAPAMAMLDTLGNQQAKEQSFPSMLYFIKGQGSRLVQIRALQGKYPFYGEIETTPKVAAKTWDQGRNALVDKTVMLQFNARPGDSIQVGKLNFAISGYLDQAPGQIGVMASISPVVYIPFKYLAGTGLAQFGSRIHYSYYYKFDRQSDIPLVLKKIRPVLDKEGLDHETVASKKQNTGRAFQDLTQFLSLAGFIALLLGCIGVGSAIHVYISEKMAAIATLRCLGVSAWQAFFIYLIQLTFIGFIGAVAGAAAGTGLQFLLPYALRDFLPVDFNMQISWMAILQGIITGVVIAILFALPSLLSVRRISPLNAIRVSFEQSKEKADPIKMMVYLIIFLFVLGFTYLQMNSWLQAVIFSVSLVVITGIFYGLSVLLLTLVRKVLPAGIAYTWRQGFSNLYRPNNLTLMLIVAIGLSTTLIATLYFVQGILINKVTLSSGKVQPDMALFDIQSDQVKAVNALAGKYHLPLMNQVPVVTMRLEEINGKTAAQLAVADSLKNKQTADKGNEKRESSASVFKNEIRATYQTRLTGAEKVTSGTWTGQVKSPADKIYISLDERYAERIGVKLGDQMLFNVQGMMIPTVIGSLRKVEWGRVQTNFRVVFPAGVLEDAPQFHVLMTKIGDAKISAQFQAAVVRSFPNISVIDLGLVLQVLDTLLSKISFVIRFMASFSIVTGWIVLISAVRSSKNQRLREIVLLRTIGANGKQILSITAIEYLFLGLIAAVAGVLIAMTGSWIMAVYLFGTDFTPSFFPVLLLFSSVILIVVITGMLSSRGVLTQPPLAVLRKDS